jgi:hypothetical protein
MWRVIVLGMAAWPASDGPQGKARLLEVRRIADQAPHSAFTDLTRHSGRFYCVFREGAGHVSPDGAIRVLASDDGREWTSAALLRRDGADLRDPKLSVTPDGRLMLLAAAALPPPSEVRHQTYAWFSGEGSHWSEPVAVGDPDIWLWRVAWHEGTAYGVGYATTGRPLVRLYRSRDGRRFEAIVPTLFDRGEPNEAGLAFLPDGTLLCLLRRDGAGANGSAQLGQARPPYTDWNWKDLGVRVGGPALLALPDGRIVAGVRLYDGRERTALAWIDPEAGTLREILALPSGGDTSYPGLLWHDETLWVSYYASHEGKSAIYLARVALDAPEGSARPGDDGLPRSTGKTR